MNLLAFGALLASFTRLSHGISPSYKASTPTLTGATTAPTAPFQGDTTLERRIWALSCSPVTTSFATSQSVYCSCNNGETRPLASTTQGVYTPCPDTTASTSSTTGGPLQLPYTMTDPFGEKTALVACQGSSVEDLGASPVTVVSHISVQKTIQTNNHLYSAKEVD